MGSDTRGWTSFVDERRMRIRLEELLNSTMVIQVIAILAGLVAWELYSQTQPAYIFPSWSVIFAALVELIEVYDLLVKLGNSVATVVTGFLLAVVVGVPIAFLMGLNHRIGNVLNPYVNALYVAPISAFIPLIIYIGGANFESRVFVVFMFAIFEIVIDTYQGIETTPNDVVEAARSFGASRRFVVRNIVLPHNLPYMFTGFRLGIGRAVRGMILAELLVEFSNIGGLIRTMENGFRLDGVLALALVVMVLGIVMTQFVRIVQQRTITWSEEVEL